MTITTIAASPRPSWCDDHRDGGDAGLIHASAVRALEDFADGEGILSKPTTTLEVRIEQFEGFDPTTRRVYREDAEIIVDDVRRPVGNHFVIGFAGDARRLSDTLTSLARVLSAAEGDAASWSDVQLTATKSARAPGVRQGGSPPPYW